MCYGSVNVVADELGSVITGMESVFTKLKTAWDSGVSEGAVNVSDQGTHYFTVKDITFNTLLFGAPAPFEITPKKKELLLEAYASGMARRAFIYHNDSYKKSENRNADFETMTEEQIQVVRDYKNELQSHINHLDYIRYPKEIKRLLTQYDIDRESIRESSTSLIAEDLGNPKKIEKLLGILAVLDLSDTITEEHLKYAISYTERVDVTAEETVQIKPVFIQVYNELSKRSFTARTDLIKSVKDLFVKDLDSTMVLVEEHASMSGNSLIRKESSGIITYKLEKLSISSLENILISTNENLSERAPEGFVKNKGQFTNMHKVVNGPYRYSAGTFAGGYITDKNYLKEQNLFIVDVDDGLTIEEAKSLFKDYTYLIATTKSHQVAKGDKEAIDRFRIILPTISTFHLDSKTYSEMYMNVLNALGLSEADAKCRNSSRWYFGNADGKHWYGNGDQLLDIRPYIPHSAERTTAEHNLDNYDAYTSAEDGSGSEDTRIDGAMRWLLSATTKGNRNEQIFNFACLVKDPQHIASQDWEFHTRKANQLLSEPLCEREINTIINSVERR